MSFSLMALILLRDLASGRVARLKLLNQVLARPPSRMLASGLKAERYSAQQTVSLELKTDPKLLKTILPAAPGICRFNFLKV